MNISEKKLQVLIGSALLLGLSTVDAQILRGPAQAVDGDSMMLEGVEVRLHGLDAPELGQSCTDAGGDRWACGEAARDALNALVDGKVVMCRRVIQASSYIGDCRVGETRLSAAVLANGWAVVDRRGSRRYVGYETQARRAELNLWSGEFDRPWEWREEDRDADSAVFVFRDQRTIAP